jgi:hypothetical protein
VHCDPLFVQLVQQLLTLRLTRSLMPLRSQEPSAKSPLSAICRFSVHVSYVFFSTTSITRRRHTAKYNRGIFVSDYYGSGGLWWISFRIYIYFRYMLGFDSGINGFNCGIFIFRRIMIDCFPKNRQSSVKWCTEMPKPSFIWLSYGDSRLLNIS